MLYIIFPIIIFIVLTVYARALFSGLPKGVSYNGQLSHLSLVCTVLGRSKSKDQTLSCTLSARTNKLVLFFEGDTIRTELPLVTELQRESAERFKAHFSKFSEVQISSDPLEKVTKIVGIWEDTPQSLSSEIDRIFREVFEVEADAQIKFGILAHEKDLTKIENAWNKFPDEAHSHSAPFVHDHTLADVRENQSGCLSTISSTFLHPLPFIIAFYLSNFHTAAIVHTIVSTGALLVSVSKKRADASSGALGLLKILVPLGAGLTAFTNQPLFLQMVPNAACILLGLYAVTSVVLGRSLLPENNDGSNPHDFTARDNFAIGAGMLLVSILGFWLSEHLRTTATLETWVWYFSYLRLELLLGVVILGTPVMANRIFAK